jgi:predicted Zn finger-like uncharacterized protein
MIVKCEQCQTRFKIPDDKVTDKGVKVRCTKCGHTFRVTRDMAQPATTATVPALQAPPAPRAAPDPFARFGAGEESPTIEVTRPGVFALGVEASRTPDLGVRPPLFPQSAPGSSTALTQPAVAAVAPPTSGGAFDFTSLRPPGASPPTVPAVPAYVPPPAASLAPAPFDFSAIAPPAFAAPQAPAPAAFDFSNFAAPAAVSPLVPALPPMPSAPAAMSTPAFAFSPPSAVPPPAFPAPAFRQSSAPVGSPFGSSGDSPDGFFGAPTDSAAPGSAAPAMDTATARSMFDLPPAASAPPSTLPDIPPPEAAPAPAAPTALPPVAARPVVPAEIPDGPRRRGVVGIVVNIVIAAVLVVGLVVVGSAFLNEGKVSGESVTETLKNTFTPNVEFVAQDVSNGLYETRAGRSVFFVRGEIVNRSSGSVKVVVKAELVEGDKVVRSAESWSGEPATPEEIFLIDGVEALEALNRRVEKRALVVPPDSAAAFVVPFTEYPPEMRGFRVRVTARAVPAGSTASNP